MMFCKKVREDSNFVHLSGLEAIYSLAGVLIDHLHKIFTVTAKLKFPVVDKYQKLIIKSRNGKVKKKNISISLVGPDETNVSCYMTSA